MLAPAPRWLAALAIAAAAPAHSPARADTAAPESQRLINAAVRQAVLGIVSYSHWPARPKQLHLCVLAGAAHAGDLLQGPMLADHFTILPLRMAVQDERLGRVCDILYSGRLTAAQWMRIRAAMAGRPALTITEDDPPCAAGAMFCLDTSRTPTAFAVNLDSVARSGVKISPQVLLLGRRRTAP